MAITGRRLFVDTIVGNEIKADNIVQTPLLDLTAADILMRDAAGNALLAKGTAAPTDTTAGYAVSCIFLVTDTGGGVYINTGTAASCAFVALGYAT